MAQLAQLKATTILDSAYKKTEIPEFLKDIKHLERRQKQNFMALLTNFEDLFDGTLGNILRTMMLEEVTLDLDDP